MATTAGQVIITGDAREYLPGIPDGSINAIITDPPYSIDYLWAYRLLGRQAIRILTPGSYLFAYGGVQNLPQQVAALGSGGLDFFWVDSLIHTGGMPRMWHKKILSGWKPVYTFTKGEPRVKAWRSSLTSATHDKRFHKWGQGIEYVVKILEILTEPGDVILDPFCGGGQVPAACRLTGRSCMAIEVNPITADAARERVANTQMPLTGMVDIMNQAGLGI